MTERRPLICLDFDGVIHDYLEGWKGHVIYGNVTPGFWRWAERAKDHFRLVIYSSRSQTSAGVKAMQDWLCQQWVKHESAQPDGRQRPVHEMATWFEFSDTKPPAFLTIDDRCVRFGGRWDDPNLEPYKLKEYRTWSQPDVKVVE
jgi:hypothetical protein